MAFYEFTAAMSGLHSVKTALSVTSGNVSNASTPGYTRLVTELTATPPLKTMFSTGMVGTGATVKSIYQIRDLYLDRKYWNQKAKEGEYSVKNDQLNVIETLMNEVADVSMTNSLNNLFDSISEVSMFADDDSYRTSVVTRADSLVTDIRSLAENLVEQQGQVNDEVLAVVTKIDALGQQVATLTKEIYSHEMGSQEEASAMRDERNRLIDEISSYINVQTKEIPGTTGNPYDKKFYLLLNGQEFVTHFNYNGISCQLREENVNKSDYPYIYDVFFDNNDALHTDGLSGQLGALLQIRDGNMEKTEDVYASSYIDTPKLTIGKVQNMQTITSGSANKGQFRYTFHLENADSISVSGYEMGDMPNGVSAYDNMGNIIYESSATQVEEKTLLSAELNPEYKNEDGSYDLVLDLDIDNKTCYLTYKFKDIDGNEFEEIEEFNVENIRSITYITVYGNDDLKVESVTAKKKATAEVYTGYNGIPFYMQRLDSFAFALAKAFNLGQYSDGSVIEGITGHYYAYDKDGETGNLFFSYKDEEGNVQKGDIDYDNITALNFSLSDELMENSRNFAASTTPTNGESGDASNNMAALGYLSIKDNEKLFKEGGIYNYVNAMSTKLGIDNRQAYKYSEYYESITSTVNNQRLSISSVDLNEEMVNLIRYQQVYVASSKVINSISKIYDTLVNGTF